MNLRIVIRIEFFVKIFNCLYVQLTPIRRKTKKNSIKTTVMYSKKKKKYLRDRKQAKKKYSLQHLWVLCRKCEAQITNTKIIQLMRICTSGLRDQWNWIEILRLKKLCGSSNTDFEFSTFQNVSIQFWFSLTFAELYLNFYWQNRHTNSHFLCYFLWCATSSVL